MLRVVSAIRGSAVFLLDMSIQSGVTQVGLAAAALISASFIVVLAAPPVFLFGRVAAVAALIFALLGI